MTSEDREMIGKTFEDYIQNLKVVFQRLKEANLKLSPKKCQLQKTKVYYLAHKVFGEGIEEDADKIKTKKN